MKEGWPTVPLGQVVRHRKEFVTIDELQEYMRCRVHLHAKGIVLRDKVAGAEIKTKEQQVCRAGEFLVAEIDAKVGGFGIVPDDLEGSIVSSHYFLFAIDENQLDRQFLDYFIRTPAFREQVSAQGSTNYAAIRPAHVLGYTIPLPPLPEQRRIVAKVEELAAKIEEAKGLRAVSKQHAWAVFQQSIGVIFNALLTKFGSQTFGDFEPHVTSGPRDWGKVYSESGFRFYRAQDIGPDGQILTESKVFIQPPDGNQGRNARLCPGDLMIVITGATVGRCSIFAEGLEPGFVSQHVAVCRLPSTSIEPAFALWGLRGPQGQQQLLGQRYGQGKPGLNLGNIRSLAFPVPPLPEQRGIVAYLDDLQAKVDCVKALQAQTQAELDALLLSILDKAFKGEL
jgi:type I restriction enzyme S subunit